MRQNEGEYHLTLMFAISVTTEFTILMLNFVLYALKNESLGVVYHGEEDLINEVLIEDEPILHYVCTLIINDRSMFNLVSK